MDTKEPALRALEAEVSVLARRLRRSWPERARDIHPDLQPTGYAVLVALIHREQCRQADLVEELNLDKGAISRQIQHLVDLDLATRSRDPDDGRASVVVPTPEAVRRFEAMLAHRRKDYDARFADWTPAEIQQVADDLARYNAALEG